MTALIIDNEADIITLLSEMLHDFCPDVDVIGSAYGVIDGINQIKRLKPDLIFLDVEMDDGTGFDLLRQLSQTAFRVIFITAHDKYAIDAFKVSALDYILKPIDSDDLILAIDKARTSLKRDVLFEQLEVFAATVDLENKPKSRIVLKTTKTVYIVSVNDILWCSAEGSYTVFHLKGDQKILTSKHLKEYAKLLSNNTFFRIHKSILVNLKYVERYENTEASIIMKGDARLPVATRNKDEFLTAISTL